MTFVSKRSEISELFHKNVQQKFGFLLIFDTKLQNLRWAILGQFTENKIYIISYQKRKRTGKNRSPFLIKMTSVEKIIRADQRKGLIVSMKTRE